MLTDSQRHKFSVTAQLNASYQPQISTSFEDQTSELAEGKENAGAAMVTISPPPEEVVYEV